MGTLRYAILGLLNRRDMSGYDLAKEFETTLASSGAPSTARSTRS